MCDNQEDIVRYEGSLNEWKAYSLEQAVIGKSAGAGQGDAKDDPTREQSSLLYQLA